MSDDWMSDVDSGYILRNGVRFDLEDTDEFCERMEALGRKREFEQKGHNCEHKLRVGSYRDGWKVMVGPILFCDICPEPDNRQPFDDLNCNYHANDEPEGWAEWYPWSTERRETHAQVQCPDCGLWKIWLPRLEDA